MILCIYAFYALLYSYSVQYIYWSTVPTMNLAPHAHCQPVSDLTHIVVYVLIHIHMFIYTSNCQIQYLICIEMKSVEFVEPASWLPMGFVVEFVNMLVCKQDVNTR